MNKVMLMGRLTRDPETRYAQGNEELAIVRFSLAINRRGKNDETDFINCVAFGKTGENIAKFFTKGQMMGLAGRLQVNPYTDKDGNKRTSTDVIVDEFYFTGGKSESGSSSAAADLGQSPEGFYPTPDETPDDDLPF